MPDKWQTRLAGFLAQRDEAGLTRRMTRLDTPPGPEAEINGRRVLIFSSNDYLGLTQHPRLKQAASRAALEWGGGAGASRLVSGHLALAEDLEEETARFKHTSACLAMATGYMTNLGLVTSLAGPGDLIVSDRLNHASLVDACRLSRAQVEVYPHGDADAAGRIIEANCGRHCLIVTDGVFSMDGDVAPLPRLADLARKHEALLIVDDAHATGVLGPTGRGSLEHFGLSAASPFIVQMGTYSKALGSLGGFVAGSQTLIEFLRNKSRPFFYSTGLPPATLAASLEALKIIASEPEHRRRLAENTAHLKEGLLEAGLEILPSDSAILPIMVGPAHKAVELSARILAGGLFCPAIRPPSVPEGASRLRLSLMATHTREHLDRALEIITRAAREMEMIP